MSISTTFSQFNKPLTLNTSAPRAYIDTVSLIIMKTEDDQVPKIALP